MSSPLYRRFCSDCVVEIDFYNGKYSLFVDKGLGGIPIKSHPSRAVIESYMEAEWPEIVAKGEMREKSI